MVSAVTPWAEAAPPLPGPHTGSAIVPKTPGLDAAVVSVAPLLPPRVSPPAEALESLWLAQPAARTAISTSGVAIRFRRIDSFIPSCRLIGDLRVRPACRTGRCDRLPSPPRGRIDRVENYLMWSSKFGFHRTGRLAPVCSSPTSGSADRAPSPPGEPVLSNCICYEDSVCRELHGWLPATRPGIPI